MWYSAIGVIVTLTLSLAVPLAAAAQPPGKVYRIGYLGTDPPPADWWDALLNGLRERGYSEGRNLVFERWFSQGNAERFPELAAEMVQRRVDLILVHTTPAAIAAKHATQTIPIVFPTAIDPVGAGLVASLARPGGNLTGLSSLAPELQWETAGTAEKGCSRHDPCGGPLECGESCQHGGVARDAGGGPCVGTPAARTGRAEPAGP